MKKQLLGAAGLIVLGTAGVMAWNTSQLKGSASAPENVPTIAPAPSVDVDAAARRLGEAIRFLTISHQDSADNRVEEWTKLHAWLQSSYPATHAAMSRETVAGHSLVMHWKGSDPAAKPIILMAHQDVVPVTAGTEKDWKQPPFGGVIADGAVWGRGAMDDKGSLVTIFESLEMLAKAGFKPRRSIWIVSGHDEEVGGNGAKAAAALLKSRGVRALFTLDEGSAIIADAPVVNGPAIMIGVAEKGYATLRVTAKAIGGHSSMPPDEIGSVNLAQAIVAIHKNQFPKRLGQPVLGTVQALGAHQGGLIKVAAANPWFFGSMIRNQLGASPSGRAQLHTTIAPTMMEGSPKENVLPQSANALINYRIAPWDTSADVMAAAKRSVGNLPVTLAWDREPREPTPISSTSSEGWHAIRAVAQARDGNAPAAPFLVVGGTDSRNFTGISDDVYRFAPILLSTKETAMFHGTNEHMTLENIERSVQFYHRLIATVAGGR